MNGLYLTLIQEKTFLKCQANVKNNWTFDINF